MATDVQNWTSIGTCQPMLAYSPSHLRLLNNSLITTSYDIACVYACLGARILTACRSEAIVARFLVNMEKPSEWEAEEPWAWGLDSEGLSAYYRA